MARLIFWQSVPVIAHRTTTIDFDSLPIIEFLSFHFRAIEAKGSSPLTETATIRVI